MNSTVRTLLIGALLLSTPGPAGSVERIRGGVGLFDIFDHAQTLLLSLELGFSEFSRFKLKPVVGGWLSEKNDVVIHVGLERPFPISNHWFVVPSFSVSAYLRDEGKDLGQVLEFISRIHFSYTLDSNSSVRIGLSHISNARLSSLNPGSEILTIEYEHQF